VVGAGEALAARSVAAMAGLAIRQLLAALHKALAAEPASQSGALARWQESHTRMDALRRDTLAWQTALADDITDLVSDIEYDLRDRTRQILREVDRFFDQADPASAWPGFADWLDEQLAEAAETNFAWLIDRFDWITDRVTGDLAEYRDTALPRSLTEVDERNIEGPVPVGTPLVERFSVGQKAFTGLRGSYGGVLMFGLVTSLAGWPLINAVSIGAGALFAAKSIHDEADLRRKRRQANAKLTAQRHVDDFFLGFSKDTKDLVRQVQRRLRDHLGITAEQLRQEILASAESAKQAVNLDAADAQRRVAEARAELARLGQLQLRAGGLVADQVRMPRPRLRVAT
jgi:hypothetical protein